jgi:hypothetical protein
MLEENPQPLMRNIAASASPSSGMGKAAGDALKIRTFPTTLTTTLLGIG